MSTVPKTRFNAVIYLQFHKKASMNARMMFSSPFVRKNCTTRYAGGTEAQRYSLYFINMLCINHLKLSVSAPLRENNLLNLWDGRRSACTFCLFSYRE